jgi:hypothetical protein
MLDISKIVGLVTAAGGSLQKQVEAFVTHVSFLAQGGLTLAEVGQIFVALIELAVNAAELLNDATGEEKKQAVLDETSYLFDFVYPYIPLWIFSPLRAWLKEPVRKIVLAIADGVVEVFVAKLPAPAPAPAA